MLKKPILQLHAAVFLWGFTGILGKLITLSEGWLVWYRMILTTLILLAILQFKKSLRLPPNKTLLQLVGTGAIIALHWVCFFGSIKYANVSVALVCLSSAGLFTALLEPVMRKTNFRPVELAIGTLGVLGIYLIFHFDVQYRTGIMLGIISTLLSTIFSIINKQLVATVKADTMMLYELGGGALFLTLCLPFFEMVAQPSFQIPTGMDWFWLIILSGICTVFAMYLSLQALRHVSAFTQNIALNLEPVYTILIAFLLFDEANLLGWSFYVGFSLIVLSVVLQMRRANR